MTVPIRIAALLLVVAGRVESAVPCNITTSNSMSYMCSSKFSTGDLTTDVCSTTFGCMQGGETVVSADITESVTVSCSDVGTGYVIQCWKFANVGKVAGSCAEINGVSTDACYFGDQEAIYLPDAIGSDCIGKESCTFVVTWTGFSYGGVSYDLSTLAAGQTTTSTSVREGAGVAKGKFLVSCGPASQTTLDLQSCATSTTPSPATLTSMPTTPSPTTPSPVTDGSPSSNANMALLMIAAFATLFCTSQ
eukprot:TRINITY_DN3934_c0_g1_i1.p1 TRINITY_DN3934_c0_g1~~TRINITY_DN3934_c0_g1_i1.p1  ORF type:complete len:249 (+),score=32.26 TRINITY_DN3934_c0_g1_i1:44-790(+)